MAFSFSYDWVTPTPQDNDWIFTGPAGTGLDVNAAVRKWCWDNNDTPSPDIGPTSGQGGSPEGYVYTEMSAPGAVGDVFTMEFNTTLNAETNNITVSFYTNQRGDSNNAICRFQTSENGGGWITRATFGGPSDPNKVLRTEAQIWALRNINLTGVVTSASTRIRIQITIDAATTVWHNDYGIDTINIVGTTIAGLVKQSHQMII